MAAADAAANAAKSVGSGALGIASTIAEQTIHPKNWGRNAAIALALVFAAAVITAPAGVSTLTAVSETAKTGLSAAWDSASVVASKTAEVAKGVNWSGIWSGLTTPAA